VELDAGLCGTFGFGLSPLFADAVLQLSGELASSVQLVRRSAESRGRILTTAERRALLERFVRQWVRAHPWTAELFSLRDAGGVLRFELAADRVFRPSEPTAVLELSRAGASEKIEVPASAWPALGAVVDTLHGARRDVAGALREPAARAFVGVLRRLDAVVPARDRLAPFPLQARAGDAFAVTHMGHATLLVDSARHRVLFDPVLYAHDPAFARQPLAASQLANTSAIFVTHHHADHIDAPSLLQLPKHVPIYVPRRSDDPFDPPLAEYVRAWGFERVVEVRPGDTHSFGDLAVTALPFSGEGSDKLGFSGCTYAVAAHGRRAVFLADASPNEDGSSLLDAPSVAALAPADVVFTSWWQDRSQLWELSSLAIFRHGSDRWAEPNENASLPLDYVLRTMKVLGTRRLVSYAERASELFLPPEARSTYLDAVSALWAPLADYERAIEAAGGRLEEAEPYRTFHVAR
jgi:L-ascorbate metabolism protein UlaG (beta-lactamase superfamily)